MLFSSKTGNTTSNKVEEMCGLCGQVSMFGDTCSECTDALQLAKHSATGWDESIENI